jgi:ubiquinone biosynthesis accessory factor UbiK
MSNQESAQSTPKRAFPGQPPAALLNLHNRVQEALRKTPLGDIEKNLKAAAQQGFQKLDLVTREEFEIQQALLLSLREKVMVLEARIAALEQAKSTSSIGSGS